MTARVQLHGASATDLPLADVLAAAAALPGDLRPPLGYWLAPTACGFARWENGPGTWAPLPADEVFEVRLFGPELELRWLHEATGLGRAAWVAERPVDLGLGTAMSPTTRDAEVIEARYLVWGEHDPYAKSANGEGWTVLSTARIGAQEVPVEARWPEREEPDDDDKKLVVLHAREYVDEVASAGDGNAAVVEERWIALETEWGRADARGGSR